MKRVFSGFFHSAPLHSVPSRILCYNAASRHDSNCLHKYEASAISLRRDTFDPPERRWVVKQGFTRTPDTSYFVENQSTAPNGEPVCSGETRALAACFRPQLQWSSKPPAGRLAAISLGLLLCVCHLTGQSSTHRDTADANRKSANTTQTSSIDGGSVHWKSVEQRTQAIRSITGTIDAADKAWNSGEAKTWASHYSSHAEWTYASPGSGKVVMQRRQVEKMLPGTQFEFHPYTRTRTWISFTSSNAAEVHSILQFTHGNAVAPMVNGPIVQTLTYDNGIWLIVRQFGGSIPHLNVCGVVGNACCSGWVSGGFQLPRHIEFCGAGATCNAQHTCVAAQPPPACGGLGQQCCPDPDSNDPAYDYCSDVKALCYPWQGPHGTCEACGGAGQGPCPSSGCASGNVARGGVCEACGGAGQPCCSNGCTGGNVCSAAAHYTCTACGVEGQAPCAGNTCTGNLHPDFEGGHLVCTANCGYTQGAPCTQGSFGCDKSGVITLPQNPCVQPLVGQDLSNGGIFYCYGQSPNNSMIDTYGNCNCVPNTLNDCPVSTSVPKPPQNNTGLCIQGQFTDIAGKGCS